MFKKMWVASLMTLGMLAGCATPPATVNPQAVAVPDADNTPAAAVKDWAAAWQSRDVGKYLAAYTPDFKPAKGSHKAWVKQRTQRVGKAKSIEVTLADVQVKTAGADKATATFTQSYKSDTYSDKSKKALDLQLIKGKWLITHERTL